MKSATPGCARLDAIWSMMPTGAPTKSFSAALTELRDASRRPASSANSVAQAAEHRYFERRARRQAAAERHGRSRAADRSPRARCRGAPAPVSALHVVEPATAWRLARRARSARSVAPASRCARGRCRDRRGARGRRRWRCGIDRRQHEAVVVVGVLADQVDTARSALRRRRSIGRRKRATNAARSHRGDPTQSTPRPPAAPRPCPRAACRR